MKTQMALKTYAGTSLTLFLALGGLAQAQDDKITFVDHVMPILENACLNCHNPDEAKGGLDLTTFGATMSGGSGGEIVKAGNPEGSRIFTLMAHTEEPKMPPNKPKTDDAKLEIIKKWIAGGLLETKSSKAKKSNTPTLGGAVEVSAGRPENPAVPEHALLEPKVVTTRGNAITAIATSPWAPVVAIGGQKQIVLYNTDNYELLGVFAFEEGFPEALNFSKNGNLLLAGGGRGGKIGVAVAYDVKTGERMLQVGKEFDTALAADISPDQTNVALGGPGRNIKIFNTATGEQLHSIKKHPDWLLELEYSPDGVLLASGGRNGEVFVWEAATGIEFYELKEHQKAVTGLDWRADSNVVATCSEDGQVSAWEMGGGKQMKKWAAHAGGALSIDFSPDGMRLVTCGRDNRVKIWDLNGTLQKDISAGFTDVVTSVAFTYDGKKIISGDWNGNLKVWDAIAGTELASLASNPPSIAQQMDRAKVRMDELTKQIPTLEQAAAAAVAASAGAKKARTDIDGVLAGVRKQKADAEGVIKANEKAVADATAQAKQAQGNIEAKKKAIVANAEEVKKQEAAIAALKADLQNWENQFKARNDALVKAKADVDKIKVELAQLPDNPDIKARLAAAEKIVAASQGPIQEADTKRKQAGGGIAPAEQKLAQIKQAGLNLVTEQKAAELIFNERNKLVAEASKKSNEAKVVIANADKAIQAQDAAIKAADAKLAPLAAAEAKAAQDVKQAKFDLDFTKYQIDKWSAAAVNVVLHENKDVLENSREKLLDIEGQGKDAQDQLQKAIAARTAAEKALEEAKKTIAEGNQYLATARNEILESRLKVIAARALDEVAERVKTQAAPSADGTVPAPQIEAAALQAIQAQVPELAKVIKNTYEQAAQKQAIVQKASEVAQKSPIVIQEQAKLEVQAKSEMEKAKQLKARQETEIQQQTQRVDELEKKYKDMYREWDPASEKVAAK